MNLPAFRIGFATIRHRLHSGRSRITLRHSAEAGFGLIELMISMAIASVLVLGLMALVGNMQRTYSTQTDLVGVSDKERFAGALFANSIQTAGYYTVVLPVTFTLPNPIVAALPASATGNATYVGGQVVSGTTGASASAPDTLNVRFQSNANDTTNANCQGGVAGATNPVIFESVFSISNGNLVCNVYTTTTVGATNTTVAGTPVILIDGVSNMKVLYGVDVSGSSSTGSVTEYFTAANLPAASVTAVRSIQVTLTFAATANLASSTNSAAAAQTYSQLYQVMYAVP